MRGVKVPEISGGDDGDCRRRRRRRELPSFEDAFRKKWKKRLLVQIDVRKQRKAERLFCF